MPRRIVINRSRLDAMLALPTSEAEIIRHYTLSAEERALVTRRRRAHNRLALRLAVS